MTSKEQQMLAEKMRAMDSEYQNAIVEVAETMAIKSYVFQRPRGLHALFVAARGRAPQVPHPRRPA